MKGKFTPKSFRSRASIWPRFGGLLSAILLPAGLYAQQTDTLVAARDASQNTRMVVFQNGGFLLGGTFTGSVADLPATGAGTRVMWHPGKSAFRAGTVSGNYWDNPAIGDYSVAMGNDVRATASAATAFGLRTGAVAPSSFAVGEDSYASGPASVAMGFHAHTNARQGSFVFADKSIQDTLRSGVDHSASWRVRGGFRIFTSSNLSTGITIQSGASISNWGQSNAVISTSTGALLTTSGVWQNVSDVNKKHLFEPISNDEVLDKLRRLPVTRWSYKVDGNKIRHIGPTAQDFYAAFGLGHDDRSIGTVDADGVALAGIKALEERTRNMAAELANLKADNAALHQQLRDNGPGSWMNVAGIGMLAFAIGAGLLRIASRRQVAQGA